MLCGYVAESLLQFVPSSSSFSEDCTKKYIVAKIDAVQAEYSAFETLHETDGLIQATKELGVAYIAYSPLGHGWLVDNFNYNSPDDFAEDDFRRKCKPPSLLVALLRIDSMIDRNGNSAKIPRRKLLQQPRDCAGDQKTCIQERCHNAADRAGMGRCAGHDCNPGHDESSAPRGELGFEGDRIHRGRNG
jgi:Aldo/keto reductase family